MKHNSFSASFLTVVSTLAPVPRVADRVAGREELRIYKQVDFGSCGHQVKRAGFEPVRTFSAGLPTSAGADDACRAILARWRWCWN
jgi:hypothetical protein